MMDCSDWKVGATSRGPGSLESHSSTQPDPHLDTGSRARGIECLHPGLGKKNSRLAIHQSRLHGAWSAKY